MTSNYNNYILNDLNIVVAIIIFIVVVFVTKVYHFIISTDYNSINKIINKMEKLKRNNNHEIITFHCKKKIKFS